MAIAQRRGVAFLFQSNSARREDAFYIFPANGKLRVAGGIHEDPPMASAQHGRGLSWRQSRSSGARPYSHRNTNARGFADVFSDLLGGGRLYLSLDVSGVCMSRYLIPSPSAPTRCPGTVTYVIGGHRGYAPRKFGDTTCLNRQRAPSHSCAIQIPGDIQFASTAVSYLQLCNDTGAIRTDAAATF